MIGQIIGKIIAHKAGIALGAAAVGVAVTAVMAAKDTKKHEKAISDKAMDIYMNASEEVVEDEHYLAFEEGDDYDNEFYDKYTTKKERAIIFAKSYWRTGMAMAVTFGLMIFSHVSMAKELTATAAALGLVSTKYKDLQSYLKENYPEQYDEIMRRLNRKKARGKISEKKLVKEESYDGRKRYYFPKSEQIVYMRPEDLIKVQGFMSRTIGTNMELYLNEILDYIHYDLGYKDVHISPLDYKWEFGEDTVEDVDFPQITLEFDDVLDKDGGYVVCQVVNTHYEPAMVA